MLWQRQHRCSAPRLNQDKCSGCSITPTSLEGTPKWDLSIPSPCQPRPGLRHIALSWAELIIPHSQGAGDDSLHSAQPHNHLDYNPNLLLSFLFIFPEGVSLWQSTKLCRWMWENPTDQYKLGISCLQLPCCAVSLIILVALFPITFIFFTSLLG